MEHTGKETYFRDVIIFIDRIKDVARIRGAEFVRSNLQLCLRGEALEWYTSQLTDGEKRLLTYGQELDEWTSFLMERFGPPKNIGMAQLLKEKYTINDATRHREPREYAMTIVRAAKVAKLDTVHNQLDIIWNGLDVEFQSDIEPPDVNATLNQFLSAMDRRKHQWWQKAARMRPSTGSATAPVRNLSQGTSQAQRSNNHGQYSNQRGATRSFSSGYQNSGNPNYSRQQPFVPTSQQNNTYSSQYQYQQRYPNYQNYQQRPRQDQQGFQPAQFPAPPPGFQQAQIPAPPQPRQITAGPTLQPSASGSRQYGNNMPPYNNNNGYRNGFLPRQPQRAYHASVGDENNEENWHMDDQACYHGEENYEDATQEGEQQAFCSEVSEENIDVNFVTAPSEIRHKCNRCSNTFVSRNALFSHLRDECWKRPVAKNTLACAKPTLDSTIPLTAASSKLPTSVPEPDIAVHFASAPSTPPTSVPNSTLTSMSEPSAHSGPRPEESEACKFSEMHTLLPKRPLLGQGLCEFPASKSSKTIITSVPKSSLTSMPKPAVSRIIESTASPSQDHAIGYLFRSSEYTTTDVSFHPDGPKLSICFDSGCPITLGDREFLQQHVPDFRSKVKHMSSHVPVRGFGNKVSKASEFLNLNVFMDGTDELGPATAKVTMEVHVVDHLKANILVGTSVLNAHGISLDLGTQEAVIAKCNRIKIPICCVAKPHSQSRRVIKTHHAVTIAPNAVMDVPVVYHGTLPDDRDFLFEPQSCHNLGHEGGVYAHVVDSTMSFVKVKNSTPRPVKLSRHARLGTIVEYNGHGCYMVSPEAESLATCGWRVSDQSDSTSQSSETQISPARTDPNKEHQLPNGVTVYGDDDSASALASLVANFEDVFTDAGKTVDIPESQWMPIKLKTGAQPKASKVYPLGQKDRQVVDSTFDKLHEQGKLRFTDQPTSFSWPCFVVWRDTPQGRKGRVVIDIRGLNAITEDDSYPLPLQSDIIALIAGYQFISTVDAVGYFHQFRVKLEDRHKLTIVSHRGQEESTVALMGYKGSPPYVQRQTDAMLRPLREFARAFVDDIVVFSHTLEAHLHHLRQLFTLLRSKNVSLAPSKSYLGYPSVLLLGQRVDSLGMTTSEEKIHAITSLRFPATLRELETFLGLTGWLRASIPRYAQRAQALQDRKTRLTKDMLACAPSSASRSASSPASGGSTAASPAAKPAAKQLSGPSRKRIAMRLQYEPTREELDAFQDLQGAFKAPTFLVHFDRHRQLYIDLDASKVWGFAAMVYHKTDDNEVKRSAVQPIMFLSRNINTAERNYWPTELEVAGIVWVVKKTRHMIDSTERAPTIIFTDHSAAIPISRQTTLSTSSTDKLNLRLVRASQYLSSFNLSIRHKSGASNVVPDALSRLQAQIDVPAAEKSDILDCLYGYTVRLSPAERDALLPEVFTYHSTLVEMTDDFKQRVIQAYANDEQWKRAMDILKDDEENLPEGFRFRTKDGLIYLTGEEGRERLCIPEALQHDVFKIAHDNNFHGGYHRTYDRIASSLFIKNLSKHLRTYIMHCPSCQLNQTRRHPAYGELHPISTPAIPFHTVAIDFIVALPEYAGFDALMTITCKSTKRNLLLPGAEDWTAVTWANTFITGLIGHDWGIPSAIISDRDSKFMGSFWKEVFTKMNVNLLTSTAWHPQTDGQSERTNQTVEIALRFFLSTGENDWVSVLPYLQGSLNNAIRSTGFAPNELVYGFRVREGLDLLAGELDVQDLDRLRSVKRQEAADAMAFANISVKSRYDKLHKSLRLHAGDLVFLRLHSGYKIPGVHHKYSNQRVGPFKILEKVGKLAYRLELPPNMHIHPVVSVAQIEPALDPADDPYHRLPPPPGPVEEDDPNPVNPLYEIERFLDKEPGKDRYLVKWKGYGNEYNAWYPLHALGDAEEFVEEFQNRRPTRRRAAALRRAAPAAHSPTPPPATNSPIPAPDAALLAAPPAAANAAPAAPPAAAGGAAILAAPLPRRRGRPRKGAN